MSRYAPYSYAIGWRLPDKVRSIFIFSGIPALYDEKVLSFWPYEVSKHASIVELKKLAREIFFSNVSEADLLRSDITDSMANDCFGVAQDLKLRCVDWGFDLSEIKARVNMQHSEDDCEVPFSTAEITARMLPNCRLHIRKSGGHFSDEVLDDFVEKIMMGHF